MIVALIDNGSLEPAAHRNLRTVAAALSKLTDVLVHPVSWKHSDRIAPELLTDPVSVAAEAIPAPAWTLAPFVRSMVALGQREFVFVPFFISAQGAIGSALRRDLETLLQELGTELTITFTDGLATRGVIPAIVADRIRNKLTQRNLPATTPVIVVDHGGPSSASALLRNALAEEIRSELGAAIGPLAAASMEGEEHGHNLPLLAQQLEAPAFNHGDVVIAPLFLSPGRHAGVDGDLAEIARAAEDRLAVPPLHCHFTELIGTHPRAVDTLASALRDTLLSLHAPTFA